LHAIAINPGDMFKKAESASSTVWVVTRVIRAPGVPTHFMLIDTHGRNEVRTISEPTLRDPNFYKPVRPVVPPQPGPSAEAHATTERAERPGAGSERAWSATASAQERGTRAAAPDRKKHAGSWAGWLDTFGLSGESMPGPFRVR